MLKFARGSGDCDHGESIYNLISQKKNFHGGCGRYVSRFACKVRQELECQKTGCFLTMGTPPPKNPFVMRQDPKCFLKKYSVRGPPCYVEDDCERKQKSCFVQKNLHPCSCPGSRGSVKVKGSRSDDRCSRPRRRSVKCHSSISAASRMNRNRRSRSRGKGNCEIEGEGTSSKDFTFDPMAEGISEYRSQFTGFHFIKPQQQSHKKEEFHHGESCGEGERRRKSVPGLPDQCCPSSALNNLNNGRVGYNGKVTIIERGTRDFLLENALAVIRCPRKVRRSGKRIDDCSGHRSIVPPNMLRSRNFGKVPCYLYRRKLELLQEDMEMKAKMEIVGNQSRKNVSPHEKAMIIQGLQNNWNDLFEEYSHISIFSSSPRILKRRAELETRLKDLERDIQLLERSGQVFVSDFQQTSSSSSLKQGIRC